jgi:drug/metabolite transporter (DMT)-like permease
VIALGLALGASVAWGASDFLGGLVSRRLPLVAVLLGAQLVGLVLAAGAWLLAGAELPGASTALPAAAAGLAELVGFACLYRGLAVGAMSVVEPLAALTAVLPVAVAVAGGEPIVPVQAAGAACAVAGTALCAWEPGTGSLARGALLGLAAALAFGVFLIGLGEAGAQDETGAVLVGRSTSVLALLGALALRPPARRPGRGDWTPLAALGGLDVLANLAFASASTEDAQAMIAVLGSLYPLTTVALARTLLGEPLGPIRGAGVLAVLAGVGLVSAG